MGNIGDRGIGSGGGASLPVRAGAALERAPETEEVCAAIEKECPALWAAETIEAEFGYEELYDPEGMLAGVRMTRSTGCKPLDESLLPGQRHFRLAFHADGKPDLDDIHAELGPGVNPDQVRIVKASQTSVSMGCR
jgi:hypothetical protein